MCYLLFFPCCFYYLFFVFDFVNLINMCLGVFHLGRIKGELKRETDPASNQFPKCSHYLEHTKRFTEFGREEKGKGGDRGDMVAKKESAKGERAVKPVIFLPSKNGY